MSFFSVIISLVDQAYEKGWENMDKQMLEKYLGSFAELTGLKVSLMDTRYRGIIVCGYDAGEYCTILHSSQKCLEACIASNSEAFRIAEQTRKPYVYRCPFGIKEMVAPVIEGDAVVGYLIAGPILENREENEERLLRQLAENDLDAEQVRAPEVISRIRTYDEEGVRSLCDMLSLIAELISLDGFLRDSEKTVGQLVKDYVKRNLSRKITLSELSLHAHCSTVTLTKHFKEEYNITVLEYITQKKLSLAETLLLDSSLSVTDIAERCGFCSTEYFSRCFKKRYGMSPVNFRRRKT